MKLRMALLVLVMYYPALAEAQVDCTKDQLNPACVPYVLKHSVAEAPSLGKWPNPPLQPLPLTQIRPAITALIPTPVVMQPTPIKARISQPQETVQTTNPAPSTSASGCGSDCAMQKRDQDYQQLGAGAGTFAAGVIGLIAQHRHDKKFCVEYPGMCMNNHPCRLDRVLEDLRQASAEGAAQLERAVASGTMYSCEPKPCHKMTKPEFDAALSREWEGYYSYAQGFCSRRMVTCFFDEHGNLQACQR